MSLAGGGANCAYWERVAADYDCEIMDTLSEDKGKVLRKAIPRLLPEIEEDEGSGYSQNDAGCGAGKWLPLAGRRPAGHRLLTTHVERAKRVYGSPAG